MLRECYSSPVITGDYIMIHDCSRRSKSLQAPGSRYRNRRSLLQTCCNFYKPKSLAQRGTCLEPLKPQVLGGIRCCPARPEPGYELVAMRRHRRTSTMSSGEDMTKGRRDQDQCQHVGHCIETARESDGSCVLLSERRRRKPRDHFFCSKVRREVVKCETRANVRMGKRRYGHRQTSAKLLHAERGSGSFLRSYRHGRSHGAE